MITLTYTKTENFSEDYLRDICIDAIYDYLRDEGIDIDDLSSISKNLLLTAVAKSLCNYAKVMEL